ncbi:Copper resistance protein [Rhodovastum atsumiense]|uniref:Copper resistance protein n=1 Tax=Rhodovastum atsumiense TaxID=504468 RepID=A0A5M6IZZ0_9PROT|nr:CopD family protein [Rhodovastum atsumiense]KAA5612945.1 copper resistance protein [Rhodovastum atsumiense]CAH2600965.1 Copper resistance protein [Rhodovastum atsumiense]
MALLIDLFGYLGVILHGVAIVAQSMALGGVLFLLLIARPLQGMGAAGPMVLRDTLRITTWAAVALALVEAAIVAMQVAILTDTVAIPTVDALGSASALAGLAKLAAALALAVLLGRHGADATARTLLGLGAVVLTAATLTTHAAARIEDRPLLLAATALHQLGAAIWIGGIPCFVAALARVRDGLSWRAIGARFSRMSMAGVGCIVLSAAVLAAIYIGDWAGLYGTAYGVMVGAKAVMFAGLLALGFGNFRVVERLRADPATPVLRLRRFAEVEIGLGFTLFFAAAGLTSAPPAIDLQQDRVTWQEIVARNTPVWPRLVSPDHDALALPALQAKLDAEAAQRSAPAARAFIPGAGELAERNAADIAWSEFNHHWAGLSVLAIGLLALANRAGVRPARHWPLLFLVMGSFLFVRSDPEVWPLGENGLLESLRDVEVLQHKALVLLIVAFGLFEWRVRLGLARRRWAPYVFPIVCAIGGAALLTHSHAISNVKEQLLIELTHTPLALFGVAAGWARWLELRLDGRAARIAAWVWPICFVLVGLTLLNYREA